MEQVAIFFIGLVLGVITGRWAIKKILKGDSIGKLHVETSDEDGPLLFIELNRPPEMLRNKDIAAVKIDTENYLTRK